MLAPMESSCNIEILTWNIKALVSFVQKLLARLKFQTDLQNNRMTEKWNERMTKWQTGQEQYAFLSSIPGVKKGKVYCKYIFLMYIKKTSLSLSSKSFIECMINTTHILACLCSRFSEGGRKGLPIKRFLEKVDKI